MSRFLCSRRFIIVGFEKHLTTCKIFVLKYTNLTLTLSAKGLALQEDFKKTKIKLDLLTGIDMLVV